MHIFTFEVDGQHITRTDKEIPVAKCRNLFSAKFNFRGEEWSGVKTALFMQGRYSKSVVLDNNDECVVPWEFFDTDSEVYGYVSVFCGNLVTANSASIRISKSGYQDSDASVPPTPDVYQQILENVENTKQIAQSVRDDANTGKFDGEDGQNGESAYQVAIRLGFVGSEQEWIDSLRYDHSDEFIRLAEQVRQKVTDEGINQVDILQKECEKQLNAVQDTVQEVVSDRQQITKNKTDISTLSKEKVNIHQSVENKGKTLVVGEDGNVVPVKVQNDGIPIINTMSGESPIIIPDSAERPMKGLKLLGKSEQVTTTGKNLVNIPDITTGVNESVKCLLEKNVYIRCNENTAVYSKDVWRIYFKYKDGSMKYLIDSAMSKGAIIIASIENPIIEISVRDINITKGAYSKIQIEYGDIATPYEPYTGGKTSPSPEYPQEIKNSGDKGNVEIMISGKNLAEESNRTAYNIYSKPILLKAGISYVLSSAREKTNLYFDDAIKGTNLLKEYAVKKLVYTPREDIYAKVYMFEEKGILETDYIQLEIGTTATNYEPYKELQTLTLTSDRPFTKYDKLVERDGQIGWLYKSKLDVIPKTGYSIRNTLSNKYGVYFSKVGIFTDVKVTKSVIEKDSQYFTHFQLKNPYDSQGDIAWLYNSGTDTDLRIKVSDDSINTVELFEKYIADKDIKILYETKDSEFIPLTKEEQDAFRVLATYYPTTVVIADGGDVNPSVEVTYIADTKNFILNREKVMQAQILNIQSALISQKISGGGIKVTDSSILPVKEFVMSGKTEQVLTTGAQLFDIDTVKQQNTLLVEGKDIICKRYANNTQITPEEFLLMTGLKEGDTLTTSVEIIGEKAMDKGYIRFINIKSDRHLMVDGACTIPSPFTSAEYSALTLYGNQAGSEVVYRDLMIVKGTTPKPFEPYTNRLPSPRPDLQQSIEVTPQGIITVDFTDGTNHQTVELNCPREFTKWDKLEKIDGVWNWVFKSKNDLLKFFTQKVGDDNVEGTVFNRYESNVSVGSFSESGTEVLCNRLIRNLGENIYFAVLASGKVFIYFDSELGINDLENANAWLASNTDIQFTFKDSSKEPDFIPLSKFEQDKLNALTMYAPTTEITNTGGCNMELNYTVDTKSYVDAKIAEVSTAIVQKGI